MGTLVGQYDRRILSPTIFDSLRYRDSGKEDIPLGRDDMQHILDFLAPGCSVILLGHPLVDLVDLNTYNSIVTNQLH